MNHAEIDNVFAFHPATPTTGPQHDRVREIVRETAHILVDIMPPSPEATLAVRKLQEAMMYANAAIACHSPGSA